MACKIIRRKGGNDLKKEMKEATLLTSLHHVRVPTPSVKLYGLIQSQPNINRVYAFDYDSQFLYIMLQLSTGGDLFTYITNHPRRRLCEGEAKYITFQMIKGLQYLHDRMISHRGKLALTSSLSLLRRPQNFYTAGDCMQTQIIDAS